ncbi:hypothetical protein [Sulfobacillus harzensis]|uniref:Uncharacterized protein n=1 Tax=Sulfobacillus harzensis TaxID=2729629 RepID=A0A7Y0L4Q4_9FIRM|nr:hypothetical protein [Sulfobacillus harzensis]NMP22927.1 hypothetical protein [Sulfobacillus harzensis]
MDAQVREFATCQGQEFIRQRIEVPRIAGGRERPDQLTAFGVLGAHDTENPGGIQRPTVGPQRFEGVVQPTLAGIPAGHAGRGIG